jgi:cell division protein FtsQ
VQTALRWGVPLVLSLAVLAVAATWVAGRARHHRYFVVREVVVATSGRLGPAEVRGAAGITEGMSIWDVDARAAEARLRAHPWIRRAEVRRELPRRVTILVREESPLAILALRDGAGTALYYVAAHARIVARVTADDPHDYPFLTGFGTADLRPGETAGPRALRRALDLLRSAGHGEGLEPVSEVHIDAARGPTLLLVRPAVPIEVGWGDFARKLDHLRRVLPLWAGREAEMAGVSLVFADDVIVRTRTPYRVAPARRPT